MSAAVDTLRATLAAVPDSWQARLGLVEILLGENRSEEAAAVLGEVTELPFETEAQVYAARAYGLFDPANGLEILDPILAADPGYAPAHFQKAFLCQRAGKTALALKHYITAITVDPGLTDPGFAAELGETSPGVDPDPQPASGSGLSDVFYPAPGEFPVRTLRDALGMAPAEPLVDPQTIPEAPGLEYVEHPAYRQPAYTTEAAFLEEVHNVQVHPRKEQCVVYDYQAPDDSIFVSDRTPDDIYVGALVTEDGLPVANLQQSLLRKKLESAQLTTSARRRERAISLFVGVGVSAAALVLMILIVVSAKQARPPTIIASFIAPTQNAELETKKIQRQRTQPNPTPAAASAAQMDVVAAMAASPVTMPDFDGVGDSPGLSDLGMNFGSSMSFGPAGGSGASMTFFGSKTKGNLAVIFDITGSMYSANPKVVKEINRAFKDAQVVAVFGATFRDMPDARLKAYKDNETVLKSVEQNGRGRPEIRDAMNDALFSLRNCDSLDGAGLQSLGRALELLLNQPLSRRPQTVFVFSDFQDGVDQKYLEKVQGLVKRRGAKVVFYHPVKFGKDKATYEAFAKATRGEVKEGL